MRIDSATGINSALTGSFSGSFIGDGTNLTGVAASSLNIDSLTALGGATVDQADNLLVSDAGTEKKVTFSNLEDTIFGNVSGDGTVAAGGALTLADGNSTRTNLGLAIGSDVQAYDAQLADVEGLAVTDGGFIVGNGSNFVLETGATARTSLGLTIGTDVQAYDAQLADVAGLAVTDGGFIVGDGSNFVLETGATARTSIGLGTGDSPTFTGLTLSGNLTVNGTTTTVNSNTLNIGDNIIAVNGVGSTLGGLAVNDSNSASGSLLWDGANNYWIAGATGSEAQVLTTGNVDSDILTFSLPASTTISAFGKTLVDDADAAAARTTLGVDAAGTDNSTNVTLAGTPDYLTLSGQEITLGTIDISDDTNFAVSDTTGQTGINLTLTGDTVSGVVHGLDTDNDVQFDSFGVGTAASGTTGEIRATNDITSFYSSDERLKENVEELEGALDKVKALRGVSFDWKELSEEEKATIHSHEGHDIGVIAQEVQAQYPELVTEREHGHLAVDYGKLTAVLIQAVKELSAKVDELSK